MDEFLHYQRSLLKIITVLAFAVFIILFFVYAEDLSICFGWALGSFVGACIFRQRVSAIIRLPDLPQDQWAKASIKSSLTVYAMLIAVVLAAVYVDRINAYSVLFGVLLERVVLRLDGWLRPGALSEPETELGAQGASEVES